MIDVNVSLSRWPFRRLPLDEPAALVAALKRIGIAEAWAGSFDAILHRDVAAVNSRLAADCREFGPGFLVPFGAANPALPDWREDLRRCREEHGMPGVRLLPNYHGYALDNARFAALLDEATALGLAVQVVAAMEDARTQHPLVRVPPVDLRPLGPLVAARPASRIVLLNALSRPGDAFVEGLLKAGRVWADTAMLEGVAAVERVASSIGAGRLLLGSHAPFFCADALPLKLEESALEGADWLAVAAGNAQSVLRRP